MLERIRRPSRPQRMRTEPLHLLRQPDRLRVMLTTSRNTDRGLIVFRNCFIILFLTGRNSGSSKELSARTETATRAQ